MRGLGRLLPVAALPAAAALSGCAAWVERPFAGLRDGPKDVGEPGFVRSFEPPVPCGAAPYPSRTAGEPGRDTVAIGPLRFDGLGHRYDPARFAPGAPALTVPVVVPPFVRATIELPPERLDVVGLDTDPMPATTPAEAHRAVRCETGVHGQVFTLSFVVAGPRCVPVSVTVRRITSTRVVPFGVRRCPGAG